MVETQVLGEKTPQNCIKTKNTQKHGVKKKKIKKKNGCQKGRKIKKIASLYNRKEMR